MGKLLINHKHCPDCGARIKGYYYYCGQCGCEDVTDWKLTGIFWLITAIIVIPLFYFLAKNFCGNTFFSQISYCKYF